VSAKILPTHSTIAPTNPGLKRFWDSTITGGNQELHPSDNLRTIPGVGEQTAPVFLAVVGDPARFHSQSAFANFNGVVPDSRQSADKEAKGLRMTKAGPAIMKWALYQVSQTPEILA